MSSRRVETKRTKKAIEGKSNNQSRAELYLMILLTKVKKIMNELYESVDKNKSYFNYVGPIKDVSFYEYMDSKELFKIIVLDLMMH